MIDKQDILSRVDHTLLKQTATWEDIKTLCDAAIENETASVCIAPAFVKQAKEYVKDKMKVCTVIGFPNGYNTTATKVYETKDAISNGADEIDMVINIGDLKAKNYSAIQKEIEEIKNVCGNKILKVIIETCFLNEEEKIRMCHIVTCAKADFIKTSTGFGGEGATFQDIELFSKNVGPNVQLKAAGGIKDFEDARKFIELGATRLGTSRLIK